MKTITLAIPMIPLLAAIIAGLFGKKIGRRGAHSVTIGGVAISFLLSLIVYNDVYSGNITNEVVYTWGISGGIPFQIGFLIVLFGLFYFIAIRPQRKRQKEHADMVNALKKGDEVAMSSGMLGKVNALDDNYITLAVASGLELKFQRVHVNAVLPKGTLKSVGTE